MVLFFSCKLISEKEILVKPSEIGIYYDDSAEKMVILNSGKHNIPRSAALYNYSLEDVHVKENIVALTKDAKQIACKVDYWYNLNSKAIRKLHVKVGVDFNRNLVLPKIRSIMRKSSSVYDFADIEVAEIEKEIISILKNDIEFSELIKTKSFKLKIEPYKY
ncbi:hypothetical protein H2O64_12010 [Kordia sp. YSTF-M3]|uniref:Band 7 domain-containing protein n=1 Tax=Kordia aestuariivivens TaxID=2759037 RepID=A0ABR7QA42_9FLAO|nr:SPFH domain-containing protein [Kordia aestuariivivens]MBC8755405.1 hypothetical protein [Kordia aestuariivivens]